MPRSSVTLVAEDLAAHGYVALVLDHPGDAELLSGGGEIRPGPRAFLAGVRAGSRRSTRPCAFALLMSASPRSRARDRSSRRAARPVDREQIAMVGHSIAARRQPT